jgi:DNA-binding transcriptional regulator YdaS (Cro superfamily)
MKITSSKFTYSTFAAISVLGLSALTGCGSMSAKPMAAAAMYSQANLPAVVQVPAGQKVAMETVGAGDITYQDMAGQFEWVFVGPDAKLNDRNGKQVGKYYGPPATWESMDGSKLTGAQVAVAPSSAGNIPLQLVKANPAMGAGAMTGVTYIQRVATSGGVAPAMVCDAGSAGSKQIVRYQADYIFYKAV